MYVSDKGALFAADVVITAQSSSDLQNALNYLNLTVFTAPEP